MKYLCLYTGRKSYCYFSVKKGQEFFKFIKSKDPLSFKSINEAYSFHDIVDVLRKVISKERLYDPKNTEIIVLVKNPVLKDLFERESLHCEELQDLIKDFVVFASRANDLFIGEEIPVSWHDRKTFVNSIMEDPDYLHTPPSKALFKPCSNLLKVLQAYSLYSGKELTFPEILRRVNEYRRGFYGSLLPRDPLVLYVGDNLLGDLSQSSYLALSQLNKVILRHCTPVGGSRCSNCHRQSQPIIYETDD